MINPAVPGSREPATISPTLPHGGPSFARALWRVAAARVTSGNDVRLLVDGPNTFDAMHELIARAHSTIDVEHYYWNPDEVGRGLIDALTSAARRGIRVRVIVDWVGGRHGTLKLLKEARRAGCEVRVFNPPGFRRWFGALPRDHRKVVVVDGRVGITGGVGIAEVWGKWRPLRRSVAPWRDTAVEIHGPAATDLARAFLFMWRLAGGDRPTREERRARLAPTGTREQAHELPALVGIVEGEPGRARVARALQTSAVGAERSIWLATAYFLPSPREVEAFLARRATGSTYGFLSPTRTTTSG